MNKTAAVLLHTPRGSLIMQHRDNKPGIDYPDYVTLFGGMCEAGEEPIDAAAREIGEELGVEISVNDLRLWKVVDKQAEKDGSAARLHIFECSRAIDITQIHVSEGQGFSVINPKDDLNLFKMTNLAREYIPVYFAEKKAATKPKLKA